MVFLLVDFLKVTICRAGLLDIETGKSGLLDQRQDFKDNEFVYDNGKF